MEKFYLYCIIAIVVGVMILSIPVLREAILNTELVMSIENSRTYKDRHSNDVVAEVKKIVEPRGWYDKYHVVLEIEESEYIYSTNNPDVYTLEVGERIQVQFFDAEDDQKEIRQIYWNRNNSLIDE